MLTQSDLSAIGNLIDERLEVKLEEKLESKLTPIRADLQYLKKDNKKLHKEIRDVLDFLDRRVIKLDARMDRVETKLGLPPML